MQLALSISIAIALLCRPSWADLPDGCVPLNEQPFSTLDPSTIFEANQELGDLIPPKRMGDWRSSYSIPTQLFAINQAKPGMAPIRQGPYSMWLESDGVTYDAYTLDRWSAPERSDEMQQQTPSVVDAPWDKVTSLGTNMKQIVSAPDGNPLGTFTGRSGVRVGILGAGDPTWTGFGEMYADFLYTDISGGTMEVPIVRGSAFATHRFQGANPVAYPYCLSSVNGIPASFSCSPEREIADPGEGFLDGTCSGGVLTTYLRSTKAVDLADVQWAANTAVDWPSSHPMTSCGAECELQPDGNTVAVTIPGASGDMNFAFNVIGKYVIPTDWVNNPATTTCTGQMRPAKAKADTLYPVDNIARPCDADICHYPTCDIEGSVNNFELEIQLTEPINGLDEIQVAASDASVWSPTVPMLTCTDLSIACTLSPDGTTVTYNNIFSEQTINYAINVLGRFVKPPGDWQGTPYEHICGTATTTEPPATTTTDNPGSSTTPGSTVAPSYCGEIPTLTECPSSFCKQTYCEAASGSDQYFKLVVQLEDPITGIDDVQLAVNTGDEWDSSHPMVTCTPDVCTLEADMKTLIYCDIYPAGAVKYAVNVIGQFIQPPSNWETDPFQTQCGGVGIIIDTGTKFVLELDEPNDDLPGQTRKYVIYFPEEMTAILDADGVKFEPVSGGLYTGIMQMAYAGSNTRGDLTPADFYDQYQGVYSYQPVTSFCAMDGNAYLDYNWNKHDADGPTVAGDLLMVALPHHETVISGGSAPIDTPFTFKGYTGDFWLLQYDLPPSTLDPDPAGVQLVQENPEWNTNVLNGLDVDTATQDLDFACVNKDSYWLGKDIAMVARLASVSRAFGTTHYETLDPQLLSCIEKWLRLDDTLADGNKFRYDTVYGGLLLRSVAEGSPIDPVANYGFPVFSDHHFHLGYLIYAMAYYAKHYPSWAQANLERIKLVVRDVSSPSTTDEYFPVARHKDFYIGHSWATGILAGERQQESSSEAINCYHAVAALGEALGDTTMEQTGQVMLAMEIHSVRQYYHVRSTSRDHFPPHVQSYGTIGMFGEDNVFLYTLNWPCDPFEFPMRHACLVGIQILPIISVSNLYMDQEWATSVYDSCSWALDPLSAPGSELVDPALMVPVSLGWGAFCHTILSKYDSVAQAAAAEYVKILTPTELVSGSGVASTLLYIYGST